MALLGPFHIHSKVRSKCGRMFVSGWRWLTLTFHGLKICKHGLFRGSWSQLSYFEIIPSHMAACYWSITHPSNLSAAPTHQTHQGGGTPERRLKFLPYSPSYQFLWTFCSVHCYYFDIDVYPTAHDERVVEKETLYFFSLTQVIWAPSSSWQSNISCPHLTPNHCSHTTWYIWYSGHFLVRRPVEICLWWAETGGASYSVYSTSQCWIRKRRKFLPGWTHCWWGYSNNWELIQGIPARGHQNPSVNRRSYRYLRSVMENPWCCIVV